MAQTFGRPASRLQVPHVFRPTPHRSELSTATMLSLAAELRGGRSKKPAGYKTAVLPRDVHGNVKDIAPLDIQARVSRRPKPEAVAFARDSSAALLIWGDAHASLKPRPPPAARGAPPGSPYAHTGLEPRTSRPQIVCHSHVRAMPWTGRKGRSDPSAS